MRRAFMKLAVPLVAGLVFAFAVPAGAATSEKNDLVFALEDADCGGGLTYDIELTGREIIHDMGDKVEVNVTFSGEAVASNGSVIRVHHAWTETWDYTNMTLTTTGVGYGTWVERGSGKILDVGRLVIDLVSGTPVFVAGHWTENFDPHVLTCELIASA